MRAQDIPCKRGCEDRNATCHPTCEKYQAFVRKCEAERKARKIAAESAYDLNRMRIRERLELKNQKRGRKR